MRQGVLQTAQMNGAVSTDAASMYSAYPQNTGCYYPYYNTGMNSSQSGDPSQMAYYMNPQLFMTQFAQFMQMMGGGMGMPMGTGGMTMPMGAGGMTMPTTGGMPMQMPFQQMPTAPVVNELDLSHR